MKVNTKVIIKYPKTKINKKENDNEKQQKNEFCLTIVSSVDFLFLILLLI